MFTETDAPNGPCHPLTLAESGNVLTIYTDQFEKSYAHIPYRFSELLVDQEPVNMKRLEP